MSMRTDQKLFDAFQKSRGVLQWLIGLTTTLLLVVIVFFAWQSVSRISAVTAPDVAKGMELPDSHSTSATSSVPAGEDAAAIAARALPDLANAPATPGFSGQTAPRAFTTKYERLLAPHRARLDFEKARVEAGYGIVIRDTILPILQTLLAAFLAFLFAVPAAQGLADLAAGVRLRASAKEHDAQARLIAEQRAPVPE